APPGAADPRRAAITVEHLLDMSTGLACDDDDDASPGNEDTMQQQTREPDWYRYTWRLPLIAVPGTKTAYCSATINLLGAVLERKRHTALDDDFFTLLARPLDMPRAAINLMPTGQAYLGGGARLRTRDFAKLAELVLERGQWRGRQIVSAAWLARATAAHASIHAPDDYGFGWWRTTFHVGGRDVEAYNAGGNGGQLAFAVPSLDLVIAINAGNYGNFATWRKFGDELVPQILAAAR
ncbi:MAG: serine hydrolase domain-containing protein, partial [Acidobacteriota bacterium]